MATIADHHQPTHDRAQVLTPQTRNAVLELFPDNARIREALNTIDHFNLNAAQLPDKNSRDVQSDVQSQLILPLIAIANRMKGMLGARHHTGPEASEQEREQMQQRDAKLRDTYTALYQESREILKCLGYGDDLYVLRATLHANLPDSFARLR